MFTLGRKIDITYNTNKLILVITLIVAAIGYFMTGHVLSGIYIGAGSFLTWALAREIDPKHDYSAFVGVGLSLLNLFYYGKINLLIIFWIILMLRILNGISGEKLKPLDIFSVLGLTIYLSINNKNIVYIIPFIFAMIFASRFEGKSKMPLVALLIGLGAGLVELFYFKYFYVVDLDFSKIINILALVGSFIFITQAKRIDINNVIDDRGQQAQRKRIRATQMFCGNVILLLFLFVEMSPNNIIIYLSAMIGVIIYSLFVRPEREIKEV